MSTDGCAAVLFDLDGTLLDTAPDMAWALNQVRHEQGLPALSEARIRPHVSKGGSGLIRLAFGLERDDPRAEPLRQRFIAIYAEHLSERTRLFPGMDEVLVRLEAKHLPWGIVTNKPGWLTRPLLAQLALEPRAACVIAGDTTAHAKPHPEPVLAACRALDLAPAQCLFIGDDARDIAAGRAAGTRNLVALFGYLGEGEDPQQWQADGYLEHPAELLDWL